MARPEAPSVALAVAQSEATSVALAVAASPAFASARCSLLPKADWRGTTGPANAVFVLPLPVPVATRRAKLLPAQASRAGLRGSGQVRSGTQSSFLPYFVELNDNDSHVVRTLATQCCVE